MRATKIVVVVGVIAIAVLVGVIALRGGKATPVGTASPESDQPAPTAPAPSPPPPLPARLPASVAVAPLPTARPAKAPTSAPASEVALMQMLRDLSGSNPELSLKLAREGNQKFKDSADAPEREWHIVRSLMNLSRVDEARAEARLLVDKYPTSEWAQDVHRHMFVNPPGHPLERGYGKKLELEK